MFNPMMSMMMGGHGRKNMAAMAHMTAFSANAQAMGAPGIQMTNMNAGMMNSAVMNPAMQANMNATAGGAMFGNMGHANPAQMQAQMLAMQQQMLAMQQQMAMQQQAGAPAVATPIAPNVPVDATDMVVQQPSAPELMKR